MDILQDTATIYLPSLDWIYCSIAIFILLSLNNNQRLFFRVYMSTATGYDTPYTPNRWECSSVYAAEVKNRSHTQRMKALRVTHKTLSASTWGTGWGGEVRKWRWGGGIDGLIASRCGCSHLISTFPVGVSVYHFHPSPISPITGCCTAALSPVSLCPCLCVCVGIKTGSLKRDFDVQGSFSPLSICWCRAPFLFPPFHYLHLLSFLSSFFPLLSFPCVVSVCLPASLTFSPHLGHRYFLYCWQSKSEWHSPVMTDTSVWRERLVMLLHGALSART